MLFTKFKEAAGKFKEAVKEKIEDKVEDAKEYIRTKTRFSDLVTHAKHTGINKHIASWVCICDKCQVEKNESIEFKKNSDGTYCNSELEERAKAIQAEFEKARQELKDKENDKPATDSGQPPA